MGKRFIKNLKEMKLDQYGETLVTDVITAWMKQNEKLAALADAGISPVKFVKALYKAYKGVKNIQKNRTILNLLYDPAADSLEHDKDVLLISEQLQLEKHRHELLEIIDTIYSSIVQKERTDFAEELEAEAYSLFIRNKITVAELAAFQQQIKTLAIEDLDFLQNRALPEGFQKKELDEYITRLSYRGLLSPLDYKRKIDYSSVKNSEITKSILKITKEFYEETPQRKKKLSPDEQVDKIEALGIECDRATVLQYLSSEVQYFKIMAYRDNFEKRTVNGEEKYISLKFDYLVELYEIDRLLGSKIVEMALDIEQQLKVNLLGSIDPEQDDGYSKVARFLFENPDIQAKIVGLNSSLYCSDLVSKYCFHEIPVWVLLEFLSFSELLRLMDFYSEFVTISNYKPDNSKMLQNVRAIRNAAAHNNCLIIHLKTKYIRTGINLTESPAYKQCQKYEKATVLPVNENSRRNKLGIHTIYDFVSLLFVYSSIMPEGAKKKRFTELQELFNGRIVLHKDYFMTNSTLISTYEFIVKVLYHVCSESDCLLTSDEGSMYASLIDKLSKPEGGSEEEKEERRKKRRERKLARRAAKIASQKV